MYSLILIFIFNQINHGSDWLWGKRFCTYLDAKFWQHTFKRQKLFDQSVDYFIQDELLKELDDKHSFCELQLMEAFHELGTMETRLEDACQ